MLGRRANSKSKQSRRAQENINTDEQLAAKLKLLLAALILALAFSINSYLAIRASLPAAIDYGAVYESLHQQ